MIPYQGSRTCRRDGDGQYVVAYVATSMTATSGTTIDLTDSACTGANTIVIRTPRPDPLQQYLAALRRAVREARERSEEALSSARIGLRSLRDDPGTRIPVPERHGFRRRPQFAKRVCGGSSRYRVLVA
jgi:hypothetical protein